MIRHIGTSAHPFARLLTTSTTARQPDFASPMQSTAASSTRSHATPMEQFINHPRTGSINIYRHPRRLNILPSDPSKATRTVGCKLKSPVKHGQFVLQVFFSRPFEWRPWRPSFQAPPPFISQAPTLEPSCASCLARHEVKRLSELGATHPAYL